MSPAFVTFLPILLLLLVVVFIRCERPNIVIIIADDLGWNDVGFHSGDVHTPNIDALAYHGVILTRHYAQPLCSPSRTALLTGDYPLRHGMQANPCIAGVPDGLPTNAKLMPQYFSKLGYKSHLVGKWHLGYETKQHLPTRRGFDSFFGYLNGFLGYWDCTHYTSDVAGRDIRRNEEGVWRECYGRYLTELLTEEAVEVIENHPEDNGLLLILAHAAVHTTHLDIEREAPPNVANTTTARGYLTAMLEWLDKSVGEVTSALDKKGLLNNSIILFISDNGAPTTSTVYSNGGSNWPLRGEKASVHEGGVRTVATVWSSLFKNNSRVSDQYFHISDWLPTLYTAAGGNIDDLESKDGINQWPSLLSSNEGTRNTVVVNINEVGKTEAVIKGNWKIVKNNNPRARTVNEDLYYGVSGRWMKYDVDKVNESLVAQTLGPIPETYQVLREAATVQSECKDQEAAMAQDCHSQYCLFNILADPTECYNLASNYSEVVDELASILDGYRLNLVPVGPKYLNQQALPKKWNDYWSPWMS